MGANENRDNNDSPLVPHSFAIADEQMWQQAVSDSLRGQSADLLATESYEGIILKPMYTSADTAELAFVRTKPGQSPGVRGSSAAVYLQSPWLVAQECALPTPQQVNQALNIDFEMGQTAVNLLLDGPTHAGIDPDRAQSGAVGHGGMSLATVEDLAVALEGIGAASTPIMQHTGAAVLPIAALLLAHVKTIGADWGSLRGSLLNDPMGELAVKGTLPRPLDSLLDDLTQLTQWAGHHAPHLATVAVRTIPYHDAGASATQELAVAIATGVTYLRALTERGVDIETAARHMVFEFAIGPQFFMEIAKLRAARLLWSQVVAEFGGSKTAQRMTIHGRTANVNQTLTSPETNMLRVTTEALSAVLSGVDSLHVSPYSEAAGVPSPFSLRIARNAHHILREEVQLNRLVDPAGGTWAVESLVNSLAHDAWSLFQTIESQGGMEAVLLNGFIRNEVAAVRAARDQGLATRKDVLVGTNQFANGDDTPLPGDRTDYEAIFRQRSAEISAYRSQRSGSAELSAALAQLTADGASGGTRLVESAISAALAGATLGEITLAMHRSDEPAPAIKPLPQERLSTPYEDLRSDAHRIAADMGRTPTVFLANLGTPRQFRLRADFAASFFEPAGFEILNPPSFDTWQQAAEAALASGAAAVVICSSDDNYTELVPPLAGAIKAASPETAVVVAGRPGDLEATFRAAGVDEFIFMGADCVTINRRLLDLMGGEMIP